jgi:hypothetical protein
LAEGEELMALFSQRAGITPLKRDIQTDTVDQALRNGLWSALDLCYWRNWEPRQYGVQPPLAEGVETLCTRMWLHLFKKPIDAMPTVNNYGGYGDDFIGIARGYFFECKWFEVYDLIEFVSLNGPDDSRESFARVCNDFMETENAAYRLVNSEVTKITSETEIEAIETAAQSRHHNVNEHLATALRLLSDRKSPDYRNSIKESISALESLCATLCGDSKATLGAAIKTVGADIHPAFVQGVQKFYGFTSDSDGVRHAIMEESKLTFADAKFMLVACAGLVNYLIAKQAEK